MPSSACADSKTNKADVSNREQSVYSQKHVRMLENIIKNQTAAKCDTNVCVEFFCLF